MSRFVVSFSCAILLWIGLVTSLIFVGSYFGGKFSTHSISLESSYAKCVELSRCVDGNFVEVVAIDAVTNIFYCHTSQYGYNWHINNPPKSKDIQIICSNLNGK